MGQVEFQRVASAESASKLVAMPIPAIILAAGASRRLGHPKQLVVVKGETLLARSMRMAIEAGAGPVLVVLGANQSAVEAAVDLSAVRKVVNAAWEQGIASSIQAGVRALEELDPKAAGAMILVCDQPRLTAVHLRALIDLFESTSESTFVASGYAGAAGIPAIFPSKSFGDMLKLSGDEGARHLLRTSNNGMRVVEFNDGEFDIDSAQDVEQLERSPQ